MKDRLLQRKRPSSIMRKTAFALALKINRLMTDYMSLRHHILFILR